MPVISRQIYKYCRSRIATRIDGTPMTRFAAILSLLSVLPLLAMPTTASAQTGGEKHNSACARDVARHCRSKMNDGDMVVLECLKEHRSKLSKSCARTLAEHGQ
jgi:hypothetical protein